ncbi:MAG: sodium:calcium antiporter [Candidatus Sumerlaeia bacterium]|nr:sodium:calcium antiporter [Candidatus Sumerlaeia bacterium]
MLLTGFVIFGLALLVFGSHLFVGGAILIAKALGVSDLIIGLTIVAAGTSLPEVAASVMAALKGERDIAIGNVVGSNVFNILGVLGFSALLGELVVEAQSLYFDIPVLLMATLTCLPLFLTGFVLSRKEGTALMIAYGGYVILLILYGAGTVSLERLTGFLYFILLPVWVLIVLHEFFSYTKTRYSK